MVLFVVKWISTRIRLMPTCSGSIARSPELWQSQGSLSFERFECLRCPQIVATYEFPDMAAWATWYMNEDAQKVWSELHTLALNVTAELWYPSPVAPAPSGPVDSPRFQTADREA